MLLGSFTDFLDFPRFSQEEAFASQPSDRSGRHAQGARGSGGWQLLSGSDPWCFFGKGVRGFWWLASSSNWGALKSPTEQFPTPPFSLGGGYMGVPSSKPGAPPFPVRPILKGVTAPIYPIPEFLGKARKSEEKREVGQNYSSVWDGGVCHGVMGSAGFTSRIDNVSHGISHGISHRNSHGISHWISHGNPMGYPMGFYPLIYARGVH